MRSREKEARKISDAFRCRGAHVLRVVVVPHTEKVGRKTNGRKRKGVAFSTVFVAKDRSGVFV